MFDERMSERMKAWVYVPNSGHGSEQIQFHVGPWYVGIDLGGNSQGDFSIAHALCVTTYVRGGAEPRPL